jgi:bacteriocin biosynthesis cyclodehydratase domain-containing protein
LNTLQFKPHLHVEVLAPDSVFLLNEDGHRIITGRAYTQLAPLLNGQLTREAVLAQLARNTSAIELIYAFNQLEAKGYLTEADPDIPSETAAFWYALGVDARQATERIRKTVTLTTVGAADAAPVADALAGLSIGVGDAGALRIVLTDDYLQPALARINRDAMADGHPWLLAKLVGATLWIGPLFDPGKSACWACMAQRIQGNRQVEAYVMRKNGQETPLITARAAIPATVQLGAQMLATEAGKWLAQGHNPQLHDQIIIVQTLSIGLQKHRIVRRPQCPICGDRVYRDDDRSPSPIELTSDVKRFISDGGHRSQPPEKTLAHYQHHISPITGVVSSLSGLSHDSGGMIYSYAAGHNFAMWHDNLAILRTNLRSRSGGKGMSDIQARVSAIGEAIERYSGVYRAEEELLRSATHRQLGSEAIDLRDVLLFSDTQYANRDAWNVTLHTPFHYVPRAFEQEAQLNWTPLWSLTNHTFKYLPTSYCYYGFPEPQGFCYQDSNGCASGNTLAEAILQGFLELVERDSVAIWWYNRLKRPAVDVESFGCADYFKKLRTHYASLDRTLWVLDLTSDLGIYTFGAFSARSGAATEDIIIGFGAHLDPEIAILRAITELNQFLPMVAHDAGSSAPRYLVDNPDTVEWLQTATLATHSYLVPCDDAPMKTLADYSSRASADLRDDVETCVAIAREVGLETLVLDQTRPDVGMPVCRVVVPGLRHFWRRLGPGRLYDVPVQMGWLDHPTREADLNPMSMFF